MTFHSPPIRLKFEIKESGIEFEYKIESIINSLRWIIYLITLPILFSLLIWSFVSEKAGPDERYFTILSFLFPFVLIRIIKWVYERWLLPNDTKLIKRIENILNVKIERI